MTITNPLREHRVGWAAVAGIDSTDLVRVRCQWPLGGGPDEGGTGKRVIYAWAVHSSRRRQVTAQLRAEHRRSRQRPRAGTTGSFGAPVAAEASDQPPTVADAEHVVAALTALAEQAHAATTVKRATPPVSNWYWPAFAAIIVPAFAVGVAILALLGAGYGGRAASEQSCHPPTGRHAGDINNFNHSGDG
jgi:hypothetical protein